jgi:uncharacterized protein (DUF885 family)
MAEPDEYWDRFLEFKPLLATQIGDERFDDRLPSVSEETRARAAALHRDTLARLRRLDDGQLDTDTRAALSMVEALAQNELAALDNHFERFDVLSHMWGPGTLLATLGSLQSADSPERLERYVARLNAFPRYVGEVLDVVREAAG